MSCLTIFLTLNTATKVRKFTKLSVPDTTKATQENPLGSLVSNLGDKSIVLIGMMGSGKSSVGKRLAASLNLPFVDADTQIEKAANMTIAEIFETQGEAVFRSGEARVITRLLGEGPQILATGGGAWMNEFTRNQVSQNGVSVWLDARLDVLMERVGRRSNRPLLKTQNPRQVMSDLLETRNPFYAQSDIKITSRAVPHEVIVDEISDALKRHFEERNAK